ncbi:hypothetical protein FRC08_004207 [Ceratobasidium sp. 394]|nr:hypothetical protein FRC08_004207 [Ceratobasidium sp. 394]
MQPLTSTHSDLYSEAFRVWKTARDCLDAATKRYADACASLRAACSTPPTCDATQSMLEEVFITLDSEVPNLDPSLELAQNADKIVKVLRNRSTSLVPINLLPSELLARVFELLGHSCTDLDSPGNIPAYPETLLRVSTSWRQIALDNGRLWTRIILAQSNFPRERLLKRAKARLARAHESLLDLHVRGGPVSGPGLELLTELAPRIRSISWRAHRHDTPSFLRENLPVLIEHGVPGSVSALRLSAYSPYQLVADPAVFRSMDRVEEFLATIQYLTLHHVSIDWSSSAYHNLIELELSFEARFFRYPTVDEFAAILLASPRLRALKLHEFGLQPRSPPGAIIPVLLDDLEVLFLGNIQRQSLKLLLPLIQPGSRPLYVRLQVPKRSADFTHYAQLLSRSHVVKLMVEGTYGHPPQSLFASLAHIQDLLLVGFLLGRLFLQSMAEPLVWYAKEQRPSVWPHMRNLHLSQCVFEDVEFYDTLTTPIPYDFKLWVWAPEEFNGADNLCVDSDSLEGQRLLGLLASYIPGMQDMCADETLPQAWNSALEFSNFIG